MKTRTPQVILASLAALLTSCSKHSSQPSSSTQATKNLGVVEFTEGIPQHFSLGDAKSCTATAKRVSQGIEVDFLIEVTNQDGTVYPLGKPKLIATIPNMYCDITSGGVSIGLTPKLKIP